MILVADELQDSGDGLGTPRRARGQASPALFPPPPAGVGVVTLLV